MQSKKPIHKQFATIRNLTTMSKVLSIIGPIGYQDKEYEDSKKALEAAGHEVVTCSMSAEATGKFGGKATADVLLVNAKPDDYDAVVFIGGPGSHIYFDDERAQALAKAFLDSGKLTTAICAAPSILANAGLLEGVTCTCYHDQVDNLKEHGANVTGGGVEVDGLIITARDVHFATAFGERVAESLS